MRIGLDGTGVLAIGALVVGGTALAIGALVVGGTALAFGAAWLYRNRALFNPADERNVASSTVSAGVKALTGGAAAGGEDSAGGVAARVREWISGDSAKIEAMKVGAVKPLVAPPAETPGAGYNGVDMNPYQAW